MGFVIFESLKKKFRTVFLLQMGKNRDKTQEISEEG